MSENSLCVFELAGNQVLELLRRRFGYGLWMLTRREGHQLTALQVNGTAFDGHVGMSTSWEGSLCYNLAADKRPLIANNLETEIKLKETDLARTLGLKAYLGLPLINSDDSFFGSLCAFDEAPQQSLEPAEVELIETLANLLSLLLQSELKLTRALREAERNAMEANIDALTGLYNRRAWDNFLTKEEERCKRFGHPAAIVSIDINGLKAKNDTEGHAAGDRLIQAAGAAIQQSCRAIDVVARVGGDEFLILAVECGDGCTTSLMQRLDQNLVVVGISASIGVSKRDPTGGLEAAVVLADREMYEAKRLHYALVKESVDPRKYPS